MSERFDVDKWEREHSKYFLRRNRGPWREVTEAEFISAERSAGFLPKPACGPLATGGFSSSTRDGEIEGRIDFVSEPVPKQGGKK